MNTNKKVVVVGAGPGGYAAAFYAADLGAEVTLIDKRKNPGGVCLYEGCIPSKAYLKAAHLIQDFEKAKSIGLNYEKISINIDTLRSWKEGIVGKLTQGLGQLCKSRNIKYISGVANLLNKNQLEVINENGESKTREIVEYENLILAIGSKIRKISGHANSELIMDSSTALDLSSVPENLLIIGGGYIGLEIGTVYANLGSKIEVVEATQQILGKTDPDLTKPLYKKLDKLFTKIHLQTKVKEVKIIDNKVEVVLENNSGEIIKKTFNKVLVSVGRYPDFKDLNIERIGIELDDFGFVKVNSKRQTNISNIYAIGDMTGQPMLAHKASYEGKVAVSSIFDIKGSSFNPLAIPSVVFTDPEIAYCGIMEDEAKDKKIDFKVARFPWSASGRALILDETGGLTKIIIEKETERIIGVGLVGNGAGEMISEAVLAIEMGATAKDLALTIHPHPTLSETMMESNEIFFGHSTHVYNKIR